MVATKNKPVEYYVEKIKKHILRKFPNLTFTVTRYDDGEIVIYYSPQDDELDFDIIHRSGGIATDALVDAGYRIWVRPA